MNSKIEKALNLDALYEMEKTNGKHWSKFNDDEIALSLGFQILANEDKRNLLKESKDTYYGMSWEYYICLVEDLGFIPIYEKRYMYSNFGEPREEVVVLHFKPKDELFIWSQSYNGISTVNATKMYGFYSGERLWNIGSGGWCDESECWYFDYDCREGMVHKLNKFIENTDVKFTNGKWSKRFLWFLNLDEPRTKDYDYEALTKIVVNQLEESYKSILTR